MAGGIILYASMVLLILLARVHCCNYNLNQEECIYEAYCDSYFYFNIHDLMQQTCGQSLIFDGRNIVPISLQYKHDVNNNQESEEPLPNIEDSYQLSFLRSSILHLNLSDNSYKIQPRIENLEILKTLDMSHNHLTTANLYNGYELISLNEIDYSYNRIVTIDTDESQYIFKHLTKINLSHNHLAELPNAIFNDMPDLAYLDLSYNYISNLSILTFEGIKNLGYLQLSHNNLQDINSSLFRFKILTELYLDSNQIKNINPGEFEHLCKLKILDLSNNMIQNIERGIFDKMILLTNLDLSGNFLKILDKDIFVRNNILDHINLSRNNLTNMPSNIFKQKALSFFSIEENHLQGPLKRGSFEGLKLVSSLNLGYQNLSAIEDYTFFGLEKLTNLLLNNNYINSLASKSFKTLRNLIQLDLSFNQILNIDFDKEDLLSLQSLLLNGNFITQIKSDYFDNLNKLTYLDLSNNNISHIAVNSFKSLSDIINFQISTNPLDGDLIGNTFYGLNSVPVLDISYTLLTSIKNNSFDGMTHLYNFNVSHSKVNELQFNSFQNTGEIEIMDLSFNQLKYFSVNVTELKKLKNICLNNNHIVFLSNNFIKGLSQLTKIDLSLNYLQDISDSSFEDQNNLQYLDLSFNPKMSFDIQVLNSAKSLHTLILSGISSNITFSDFSNEIPLTNIELSGLDLTNTTMLNLKIGEKLRILDLSKNNLTILEVGAFSKLTELRKIDVSYNKIKFIQPGVFKNNILLNTLNISHNYVSTLSYGVLRGLVNLKILDMSYNNINSLETERFYEVESLTDLIVDNNKINKVSAEDFHGTDLTKLSIGDNPLPCDSLIKLKRFSDSTLIVTAIRLVDGIEENYEGITCNNNQIGYTPNVKISTKSSNEIAFEQTLFDIRNILLNWDSKKAKDYDEDNRKKRIFTDLLENSKYNNSEQLSHLYNSTFELKKEVINTNQLLERLIKVTVAINSVNNSQPVLAKENVSFATIQSYINGMKSEIENKMVIEKEKILMEVDNKLLLIKHSEKAENISAATEYSTQATSAFVETCVALILFILVCFVLYKLYKSKFYIRNRRSISTHQIANALDNSAL